VEGISAAKIKNMAQEIISSLFKNLTQISPSIFWGSFLFLVGIIVAKSLESISASFFNKIGLDNVLKRIGIQEALSKIDIEINVSKFFGEMVKWFVVIVFLMASSEILGMVQFSQFLEKVIDYFPNIFIAALIFVVAAFLADFSQKVVVDALEKEKITYSRFLGRSVRWIIWFFAILAILYQLRISPPFILTVFIGLVATISIALGIAFGLGGKDLAARILKELEEKFK
jgi:hypothetical protein